MNLPFRYRATVLRVIDGDTYDVNVDLGFRVWMKIRVRLHNYDTAELTSPDAELRHKAVAARDRVRDLIEGKMVVLDSVKTAVYNRWETKVAFVDEQGTWTDLGSLLLSEGLAEEWQPRD